MNAVVRSLPTIHMQVLWNRLIAVVEEQALALVRAAFSTSVRESGDLSAAVFDRQGRMLAQAVTGTPGHVNSMAAAVKHFIAKYPVQEMRPGDCYITNDPWLASGHLHDFTVVTPTFKNDRVVALFACTAHVVDVGGRGFGPNARQVYEEGLYVPIMPLLRQGVLNQDLIEIVRWNVREPLQVEGDIMAFAACNETGSARLLRMMTEYKLDDLEELGAYIIETSRQATLERIAELPHGTYSSRIELDGYDRPVAINTALTIGPDGIDVDFAGTSPASGYGINVVLNYTRAYTAFGVKCIIAPDIPNNAGSLAPIRVEAPLGSVLNVERPRPVAARHVIGQFLPDAVFGCLAQVVPEKVPAEGASALWNLQLRGAPHLTDDEAERQEQPFDILTFNSGGSGARPRLDGLDATAFPSGVRAVPTEAAEAAAPIVIWRKELLPDSGGPGEYRGGLGQRIEVSGLDDRAFLLLAMYDRVDHPARGRHNQATGAPGRVALASGDELPPKGEHLIPRGDRLVLDLPGGGGFGDPRRRDPERVLHDVREGYITKEAAKREYYVVATASGTLDQAATQALRSA